MHLLFDQNISFRILKRIETAFPNANQVRALGLENATDKDIWEFAKVNGYAIVTFDADFFELSSLYGQPPKIIWLRTGNRKTTDLAELLLSRKLAIKQFLKDEQYKSISCLEVRA